MDTCHAAIEHDVQLHRPGCWIPKPLQLRGPANAQSVAVRQDHERFAATVCADRVCLISPSHHLVFGGDEHCGDVLARVASNGQDDQAQEGLADAVALADLLDGACQKPAARLTMCEYMVGRGSSA